MDWFQKHLIAMQSISRDTCIKEFRHCNFPKSSNEFIYTSKEQSEYFAGITDALTILNNM